MPVSFDPNLEGTEIVVPGSIGNVGPGFDTLAVAVQLYMRVRIRRIDPQNANRVTFSFRDEQPDDENRIARAFWELVRQRPIVVPGLDLEVLSDVPMRAGLGSSAAATIAGLKLFERLAVPIPREELLSMASALEGHPDNAAASLYGGLAVSWQLPDGKVRAYSRRWPDAIRFVIATPTVRLETALARSVLPDRIARADAVFNLQRVLWLVQVLETGDYQYLREALRDQWHQPSRQPLVPALERALALEHPDLLGVCLSGSGPSIVALAERNAPAIESLLQELYRELNVPCRVQTLSAHQPDGNEN